MPAEFEDISDKVYGDMGYSVGSARPVPISEQILNEFRAQQIDRAAIAQARALENKALRCLEISQIIFPHESDGELESIVSDFMYLTDNGINRILRHLRGPGRRMSPSFASVSLTEKPVPGTGIIEEKKGEKGIKGDKRG